MDKSRMDWCHWCRLTPTSSLAFKASRAVFSLSTWVAMAAVKNQLLTCAYTHRSIHHASIETLDIMETSIHSTKYPICIYIYILYIDYQIISIHMYNIWQRLQRVRAFHVQAIWKRHKKTQQTHLSWTAKTPPMVWVLPSHRSSAPILGLISLSCSRDKTKTLECQLGCVAETYPPPNSPRCPGQLRTLLPQRCHLRQLTRLSQVSSMLGWEISQHFLLYTALATPKNPSSFLLIMECLKRDFFKPFFFWAKICTSSSNWFSNQHFIDGWSSSSRKFPQLWIELAQDWIHGRSMSMSGSESPIFESLLCSYVHAFHFLKNAMKIYWKSTKSSTKIPWKWHQKKSRKCFTSVSI